MKLLKKHSHPYQVPPVLTLVEAQGRGIGAPEGQVNRQLGDPLYNQVRNQVGYDIFWRSMS